MIEDATKASGGSCMRESGSESVSVSKGMTWALVMSTSVCLGRWMSMHYQLNQNDPVTDADNDTDADGRK